MEQFIHKLLSEVFFLGQSVDKSSILDCFSKYNPNMGKLSYFLSYLAYFHCCHTDTFRAKRL